GLSLCRPGVHERHFPSYRSRGQHVPRAGGNDERPLEVPAHGESLGAGRQGARAQRSGRPSAPPRAPSLPRFTPPPSRSSPPRVPCSKYSDMYTRYEDEDRKVTASLDLVEGLGQYSGSYLEVEILVARKGHVEAARTSVEQLVQELLGETRPTADSYMEMLKR